MVKRGLPRYVEGATKVNRHMETVKRAGMISEENAVKFNNTEFFGDIVAKLAETLEATVGLQDAEGFIANVGESIGEEISTMYDTGEAVSNAYISQILVDLKRRIGGEFTVAELTDEKIVLTNTRCPFAHRVNGKRSLCMMTTNVFGTITADRNGYAHVEVEDAIADNDKYCRVVVTLTPDAVTSEEGIEFFGG